MKDYEKFEDLVENTEYNGLSEFQQELFSALMLGVDKNTIKKIYNTLADSTLRNHKRILMEKKKAAEIQYELFKFIENPIKNPKEYCKSILKGKNIYKKLKMIPYISLTFEDMDLKPYKNEVESYILQDANYYLKFLALKAYQFIPSFSFQLIKEQFYSTKNDYIKYIILKIFYDKKKFDPDLIKYSIDSGIKILVYAVYFIYKKENLINFEREMKKLIKKYKEFSKFENLEDIRKSIRKEIRKVKPTFVPLNATLIDKRFDITQTEREKVIKNYFIDSKLKMIPAREKKKIIVLQEIVKTFEKNRKYKREELNSILKDIYSDYASLRRYLIEYGFMERTSDGREYWLK